MSILVNDQQLSQILITGKLRLFPVCLHEGKIMYGHNCSVPTTIIETRGLDTNVLSDDPDFEIAPFITAIHTTARQYRELYSPMYVYPTFQMALHHNMTDISRAILRLVQRPISKEVTDKRAHFLHECEGKEQTYADVYDSLIKHDPTFFHTAMLCPESQATQAVKTWCEIRNVEFNPRTLLDLLRPWWA